MKSLLTFCAALQLTGAAFAQTAPATTAPATTPSAAPVTPPVPVMTATNEEPVDYPGAIWAPAAAGNFDLENRPLDEKIDMIIVHDIEGPAQAAINIFQEKGREVSAHYVVGADGKVFQMVREHNVGYHAGNRSINHRSIGIETEGYAYRGGWFTPTIYEAEAKLVRDITRRYAIPRDRTHIIGHFEVPNPKDPTKFGGANGHTDPGPYWNWAAFMTMVRNDAHLASAQIPPTIRPGETLPVAVTLDNTGDDIWPANTAANPKADVKATGPIVVLGTSGNRLSPLFNLQGWIGPMAAAGALADTLPGTPALFEFTLRGPRELGPWNDELRLTTLPTMAQGGAPVPFGDVVPIVTRVVPWVIDVPAPNTLPDSTAPSNTITAVDSASNPPLIARWSGTLPIGGLYAIYAAPPKPAKTRGEKPFSYQIGALDGPKTVQARAEDGGKGLLFAGYFQFPEPVKGGAPISVGLQSAPRGVDASNAGSLRFVGPFPAGSIGAPDLSQIPGAMITLGR